MKQVEMKLSHWHRLYNELGTVERELADSVLRSAHEENERLRTRAAVLKQESETAFQALIAALESAKAAHERRKDGPEST
jgi:DNA transposition AAA+ family ATPase